MNNSVEWETTTCPLCGEPRSTPILCAKDLLYRVPGEFTLARCEACQHVFLNPRPTRECIGQFYPADYGPFRGGEIANCKLQIANRELPGKRKQRSVFDPRSWQWLRHLVLWWIDSRAAPMPTSQISNFKSEISNLKFQIPRRALELGCSHGAFLQQLRERGWECVGIEPAAEVARRAAERGFDVRIGSLESVVASDPQTFAQSSFDALFAWMVIEHLHDPVATLRLVRELLKPGGTLSFSVPNFGCWERRTFGRFWYALQLPTHLQHFTTASLRRMLDASGFELVELIHQRNINNLVGSLGLWLRTKFPNWSLGKRLIRWTDNPSALGLCWLAPLARLLAMVRKSGRLTVVARRT
ncbi:MAG: class I SAM-dependent methyltransferase [Planctomycetaceae bacterium]|nr:class I SAM-dependent methyltransferase [Planctomycetaceae bacterium]